MIEGHGDDPVTKHNASSKMDKMESEGVSVDSSTKVEDVQDRASVQSKSSHSAVNFLPIYFSLCMDLICHYSIPFLYVIGTGNSSVCLMISTLNFRHTRIFPHDLFLVAEKFSGVEFIFAES